MARAALSVVKTKDTGVDLAAAATAALVDGHSFPDNGRTLLYVENGDAASHDVNVLVASKVEGLTVGPQVITVPAGGKRLAGVLTGAYRQTDGAVHVDVPVLTGMKLAAVEVV